MRIRSLLYIVALAVSGCTDCLNSNDKAVADREVNRFVTETPAITHPVTAMLVPHKIRPESFLIMVTNNSNNVIRFLDIREGDAACSDFYEVTVETDGETYVSNGICRYAPAGSPFVVVLEPGTTYERRISPGAYVSLLAEAKFTPESKLTVTYRLSDNFKRSRHGRSLAVEGTDLGPDLEFTFQTNKTSMGTSYR